MKRRKNVSGTALIIVLSIIAIITMVVTTALRSATLLYELAFDRVEQTAQLRAAQALAYYGIACCKQINSVSNSNEQKKHEHLFDHWPFPSGPYQGSITITQHEPAYDIEAILKKGTALLYTISVTVTQKGGIWCIESWKSG